MEEGYNFSQQKPEVSVETKTKLHLGTKILLTAVVLGSIAAGVAVAIILAR